MKKTLIKTAYEFTYKLDPLNPEEKPNNRKYLPTTQAFLLITKWHFHEDKLCSIIALVFHRILEFKNGVASLCRPLLFLCLPGKPGK